MYEERTMVEFLLLRGCALEVVFSASLLRRAAHVCGCGVGTALLCLLSSVPRFSGELSMSVVLVLLKPLDGL